MWWCACLDRRGKKIKHRNWLHFLILHLFVFVSTCTRTSMELRRQPAGVHSLFHYMAMRDWIRVVKFISKVYLISPRAMVWKDHEKNGPRKNLWSGISLEGHELGNVSSACSCTVLLVSTGVILFQLQWEANGWGTPVDKWHTRKPTVWQRRLDQRGREVWHLGILWGEVYCICFVLVGSRYG